MEKWEYLQVDRGGADNNRTWAVDDKDRTWVVPTVMQLKLDESFAKEYLDQRRPPYKLRFPFPTQILELPGLEGWVLVSNDGSQSIFRRPKE